MNDEKFELTICDLARSGTYYADIADELRARDTAQREAVEAWKAAQAREAAALAQAWEQRDAAQAQLARVQAELPDLRANMTKALDLLEVLTWTKYTDGSFVEAVDEADEMLEQLRGKVVLEGLAEQREARGAQAGEFQREDRYLVIKRKDLALLSPTDRDLALTLMGELRTIMANWNIPERQYVVVESDWPEYEPTWAAIQARVEGRAALATQPAVQVNPEPVAHLKVEVLGRITKVDIEWPNGLHTTLPTGKYPLYIVRGAEQ